MRHLGASFAVLAALSFPAFAAGWSSFDNTFPALPCQDGWAACLVDGAATGQGALQDSAGRPLPADARFGWFDFKPTSVVSPFASLSAYSGPVGAPAPVEAPPVQDAPPVAQAPVVDDAPVATAGMSGSSGSSSAATPVTSSAPTPVASPTASVTTTSSTPATTPVTSSGGMRPGSPSAVASTTTPTTATTPATTSGGMRPGSPSSTASLAPTTTTTTTAAPASLPPTTSNPTPTTTTSAVAPVASAPQDDSCTDLVRREPAAMMGQLRQGQGKCLDARISSESQQTTKDKISRLLISNAENKGDKQEWERLIKRHLEDIDRSDPDLCFKYALHLSSGGVGRAQGVIRWADYALDNKSKWSGTTYKTRVFSLYKLRAEAANKLWQDAEKEFAEGERSDEKEAKAAKHRGQAKDYAREWLDYAKASEQDTKTAMALCVSSSGNRAFCEGG